MQPHWVSAHSHTTRDSLWSLCDDTKLSKEAKQASILHLLNELLFQEVLVQVRPLQTGIDSSSNHRQYIDHTVWRALRP